VYYWQLDNVSSSAPSNPLFYACYKSEARELARAWWGYEEDEQLDMSRVSDPDEGERSGAIDANSLTAEELAAFERFIQPRREADDED
jgi:hypothetical protein